MYTQANIHAENLSTRCHGEEQANTATASYCCLQPTRDRPSQRNRIALLGLKFCLANLWGNGLGPGIHRNNGNVPFMLTSCLHMHFNLKSFDRRLCKKSILNKPRQKHAESLQELIIAGQEKKPDINSQEVGIKPRALDSASTSLSFWLVSNWLEMLTLMLRNWWRISNTSGYPGFFKAGICGVSPQILTKLSQEHGFTHVWSQRWYLRRDCLLLILPEFSAEILLMY